MIGVVKYSIQSLPSGKQEVLSSVGRSLALAGDMKMGREGVTDEEDRTKLAF